MLFIIIIYSIITKFDIEDPHILIYLEVTPAIRHDYYMYLLNFMKTTLKMFASSGLLRSEALHVRAIVREKY